MRYLFRRLLRYIDAIDDEPHDGGTIFMPGRPLFLAPSPRGTLIRTPLMLIDVNSLLDAREEGPLIKPRQPVRVRASVFRRLPLHICLRAGAP